MDLEKAVSYAVVLGVLGLLAYVVIREFRAPKGGYVTTFERDEGGRIINIIEKPLGIQ